MPRSLARLAALVLTTPLAVGAQSPPAASRAAAPRAHRTLEQGVDSIIREALQIPVAGIAVAVRRGDRVLLEKGYGTADLERRVAVTPRTVFEIGSITKQFTATAVVQLAERGRLRLDDSIAQYLPALAARARGVTLRHLLSHTSGLSRAWAVADLTAPSSPQVVVDSLAARPVEFAPGERYAYNNNGYILLGLVVERVSGVSYEEYVRRTFLRPLGLASTTPCAAAPADRQARGYVHATRGPAVATVAPSHHATVTFAAGELCATAGDLARWERALATGAVVSAEGWRAMTTPAPLAGGRTARYGLGVEIGTLEGRPYLAHGGATPGFLGETAYLPDSALSVTVLTNGVYAGSLVTQLVQAVAREALGLPQPAVAHLPLGAEQRAALTGRFDLGPVQIEVYEQGESLRAQPSGQVATRLLYQGDAVFVAEHDPALRFRFRMVDGRAEELVLEQGGRAMPPARRAR